MREGEGAEGVQLQTRVGPTKFHHFKTLNFENRGRGFGPRSPSGSALEMLFFICAVVNSNQTKVNLFASWVHLRRKVTKRVHKTYDYSKNFGNLGLVSKG